jgi:hypothetical protein
MTPCDIAKLDLHVIQLQASWRGIAIILGIVIKLIIFLGGALFAVNKCPDRDYVRSVAGFIMISVIYLLYEMVVPLTIFVIMRMHHVKLMDAIHRITRVCVSDCYIRGLFMFLFVALMIVAFTKRCQPLDVKTSITKRMETLGLKNTSQ